MRRRWLGVASLIAAAAMAGCAGAQADEESLRDSFAERIATTTLVTDFERAGDEITFSGPDGEGGAAAWRVRIDTTLVEPNEFDEAMPYQGRTRGYKDLWMLDAVLNPTAANAFELNSSAVRSMSLV